MKNWFLIGWAVVLLGLFSFACASSGQSKVKCPKCGAVFTTDEGLKEYEMGKREAR